MNSCILMAEITQDPQLRYTSDNQTAVAEMVVQFPGLRDDEPMATLKVVGWGNLAQDIQENYHQGDRVIIEGRLGMNMIERQEGFKEKRAELTAQKIHRLDGTMVTTSTETVAAKPAAQKAAAPQPEPTPVAAASKAPARAAAKTAPPVESSFGEDEIPF
jgi:single-strand DNA-binding protein